MALRIVINGRVALPEDARAALALLPGDPLLFRSEGDHLVASRVTLRPVERRTRRTVPARVLDFRRPAPGMAD